MRIIYAVLNMGLGHASRSLPLINQLLNDHHEVMLLSSGNSLRFLQSEIHHPLARFREIPDYGLTYSATLPAYLSVLFKSAGLPGLIRQEKGLTEKLVEEFQPHIIISDHRYGIRHPGVFSVFITHQLIIQPPVSLRSAQRLSFFLHRQFYRKFHLVLIPDFEHPLSLAGTLSNPPFPWRAPQREYCGPLVSADCSSLSTEKASSGIFVIISGPEPQRSIFEKKLKRLFQHYPNKVVMVCGKPGNPHSERIHNLEIHSHLARSAIIQRLASSDLIITRSGYTTLMELAYLKKNAILVPTPGQTEQEYLARYWEKNGWAWSISQQDLETGLYSLIETARSSTRNYPLPVDPERNIRKGIETIYRQYKKWSTSI